MGIPLKGTVIEKFPWDQQTDGGYKPPGYLDVAVQWDDGTKGYVSELVLDDLGDTELAIEEVARQAELERAVQDALQDTEGTEGNWYDTFLAGQA